MTLQHKLADDGSCAPQQHQVEVVESLYAHQRITLLEEVEALILVEVEHLIAALVDRHTNLIHHVGVHLFHDGVGHAVHNLVDVSECVCGELTYALIVERCMDLMSSTCSLHCSRRVATPTAKVYKKFTLAASSVSTCINLKYCPLNSQNGLNTNSW